MDPAFNAKLQALGLTPGQPFPNNTIPHQLFDPNAVALPQRSLSARAQDRRTDKSVESVPAPIKVRDDIVRVDHKINDKWQFSLTTCTRATMR